MMYYNVLFFISFLLTVLFVFLWDRHYNVNITAIFILIPIVNLGYSLYYFDAGRGVLPETAIKIIYVGGCYLMFLITMCILSLCEIKVPRLLRNIFFLLNSLLFLSTLTIGKYPWFYKDFKLVQIAGAFEAVKDYGFAHTLVYLMLIFYLLVGVVAILISLPKKSVSNRILFLLFLPEALSILGYFANKMFGGNVEVLPATYTFSQVVYLFITHRLGLLNIGETAIESMIQTGDTGMISIDVHRNYISSNETAREMIPALRDIKVDTSIMQSEELKKTVLRWIDHLEIDGVSTNVDKIENGPGTEDDEYKQADVRFLFEGKRKVGYQIFITDVTKNQQYLALVEHYNEKLQKEVERKTAHIEQMHDNLILSMATMVESRDNSTGGHIRRTSTGVKILMEEFQKLHEGEVSDVFCHDIIKAAPMHDIGKIAVRDAVLQKPGKFTPEEYAEMKKHSAEGAKIVHEILQDTDDEKFKVITENVAHYHHERWDGSGYPDGLKGEQIPLESRIMAIADVYDALVSKRVYKESYNFERANVIVMDGMGTQFDPALRDVYVNARPRLEAYYQSIG